MQIIQIIQIITDHTDQDYICPPCLADVPQIMSCTICSAQVGIDDLYDTDMICPKCAIVTL